MDKKNLALPAEAARVLGCSKQLVSLLIDRGELPIVGRSVRGVRVMRLQDVQEFAARRRAESEAPAE
jgi:hypothetical protein